MSDKRKSIDFIPAWFRTDSNNKFFDGTVDQLIQKPSLKKIEGYIGSKDVPQFNPASDNYLNADQSLKTNYELEPALTIRNPVTDVVEEITTYTDFLNAVNLFNGDSSNESKLWKQQSYSFDPQVDLDKLINYRQYVWLPYGPDPVVIEGPLVDTVSTYTVTQEHDSVIGSNYWLLTPDGISANPIITLIRGKTYVFEVNSPGHKFYLKTSRSSGSIGAYNSTTVQNNGVDVGHVIITVDENTPTNLYYVDASDSTVFGKIIVKQQASTELFDVDKEIVGKKNYTLSSGHKLSNGMKVRFIGNVTPTTYLNKNYIVTGVGDSIELVEFESLITPELYAQNSNINFDNVGFDTIPFDTLSKAALEPEYVTVSIASEDKNAWSRYNRWTHVQVIVDTAEINNTAPNFTLSKEAKRPILEFKSNLKLHNSGIRSIGSVQFVDSLVTNAFLQVEGKSGFYIDQVALEDGDRIIFTGDTDPLVKNKIFQINFITVKGKRQIDLSVVLDVPNKYDMTFCTKGTTLVGKSFYFDGDSWVASQQKTKLNQFPKFDLFDQNGFSFSDKTQYPLSNFDGCTILQYKIGSGSDPILPFALSYKTVGNIGDIVFAITMLTDSFTYVLGNKSITVPMQDGYLLDYTDSMTSYRKLWTKCNFESYQNIVDQAIAELGQTSFVFKSVDVRTATTAWKVYKNNSLLTSSEYSIVQDKAYNFWNLTLTAAASENDVISIEVNSPYAKIDGHGKYSMPVNYVNNAVNENIDSLTLSELSDHIKTMMQNHPDFSGQYYGVNNLRDLGDISGYGQRLLQHEGLVAGAFFIADKSFNMIKALKWAGKSYFQFKLNLIDKFYKLSGYSTVSEALDMILSKDSELNDKNTPWYYSDMLAYGVPTNIVNYTVNSTSKTYSYGVDVFTLNELSNKSIIVYLTSAATGNTTQMVVNNHFKFDDGIPTITLLTDVNVGDKITIKIYETTTKLCVPATPSKLGIYPAYEPEIYTDENYTVPTKVIRGHDGSITIAYGDSRDEFLLEFEKRIFNNIKFGYDPNKFDINKFIPRAFNEYSELNTVTNILSTEFYNFANTYNVDYTTNDYEDAANKFSFNYSNSLCKATGRTVPGFWRGMYDYLYDTDTPDKTPWFMLGFTNKPLWWDNEYGPAPYTRSNLKLWEDLEAGHIRQGSRAGYDPIYARPGLSAIIPVDSHGVLLDPITANIVGGYKPNINKLGYAFGNRGPAEVAWRKSSLYPFAVQMMLALLNPASYVVNNFDPNRTVRDNAGQIIYTLTQRRVNPFEVLFHTEVMDNGSTFLASGLNQLLVEYLRTADNEPVKQIYNRFLRFDFNLAHRTSGFVSKSQYNVEIETANNYLSAGSVFLPKENYQVVLSKTLPQKIISVSGIIIEKTSEGLKLRGYDTSSPYFICQQPVHNSGDYVTTVGGVTESYLSWDSGQNITAGALVEYSGKFYRAIQDHKTSDSFDVTLYYPMPSLPIKGGITANVANVWSDNTVEYPYGYTLQNYQEAVDVILGYGEYLKRQGFVFDYVLSDLGQPSDYNLAVKEFLFWMLQNWANNTIISLAPFSSQIKLTLDKVVADDFTDPFYDYSLLRSNGGVIKPEQINISRQSGVLIIDSTNLSNDGIYLARINLIQKESAVVFDNVSMFNDLIYDRKTGYRQRRLKVTGFITDNWYGDLFVPGFIYDPAQVDVWQSNVDYHVGDVVSVQTRYYQAVTNVKASTTFDPTYWKELGSKPVAQILPNFEYKISQFEDFYSLDTANFDAQQQSLAQRLIGYTPRNYLGVIVPNTISQYKFYAGYIREKGTVSPLEKLNISSNPTMGSHIQMGEDWAIRSGVFGGINSTNELEFFVNSDLISSDPQAFQLPLSTSEKYDTNAIAYSLNKNEVVSINIKEDGTVLPVLAIDKSKGLTSSAYLEMPTAGYVRLDDVTYTAYTTANLLGITSVKTMQESDTTWVAIDSNTDWDVKRYTYNPATIVSYVPDTVNLLITFTTDLKHNLKLRDFITVQGTGDTSVDAVYEIISIPNLYSFVVATKQQNIATPVGVIKARLFTYQSSRFPTFDAVSKVSGIARWKNCEYVWVDDDGTGRWAVYEKEEMLNRTLIPGYQLVSDQRFGESIAVGKTTGHIVIGAPYYQDGTVYVYVPQEDGSYNNSQGMYLGANLGEVFGDQTVSSGVVQEQFGYSTSIWEKDILYIKAEVTVASEVATDRLIVFNANGITAGMNVTHPNIPANTTVKSVIGNVITLSNIVVTPVTMGDLVSFNQDRIRYVIAGAPYLSKAKYTSDTQDPSRKILKATNIPNSTYSEQGAAKIFAFNNSTLLFEEDLKFASPVPQSYAHFGQSVLLTGAGNTPIALVSAPGQDQYGAVYIMTRDYIDGEQNLTWTYKKANGGSSVLNLRNLVNVDWSTGANFGRDMVASDDATWLFISAPGQQATPTVQYLGAVYIFKKISSDNTYNLYQTIAADSVIDTSTINLSTVSKSYPVTVTFIFDTSLKTLIRGTGSFIADGWRVGQQVTFAGTASNNKKFYITSLEPTQMGLGGATITQETVSSAFTAKGAGILAGAGFGDSISCNADGTQLVIGSDHVSSNRMDAGAVYSFKLVNNQFVLQQKIDSPDVKMGELFGSRVSLSPDGSDLIVSAIGGDGTYLDTFDTYNNRVADSLTQYGSEYVLDPKSTVRSLRTIFDRGSTRIVSKIQSAGTVYLYEKKNTHFVYADKMISYQTQNQDNFGAAVANTGKKYFVGAPGANQGIGPNFGEVSVFNKTMDHTWSLVRHEDDLVDSKKLEKSLIYDSRTLQVVEQFQIYDPLKGVIPKAVKNEIKYMTSYDPATYTVAANITSKSRVDNHTTWGPEHVGELWLDLSTLKYVWYEQGSIEFRNKNWGQLFPGSSVDVYEWVESNYTPADWSSLADTPRGLALGISGQPKNADNSIVSLLQIYDPISNDFINRYYFWVKNKITLPNATWRSISGYDCAAILTNPKNQGLHYASPLSPIAIGLTNITGTLDKDYRVYHLTYRMQDNRQDIHTKWQLVNETDTRLKVDPAIVDKMIDSYVGIDILGNSVPDKNLSFKNRYGNLTEPNQTWFVNQQAAVADLITFVNNIFISDSFVGKANLLSLDKKDLPPTIESNQYDVQVSNYDSISTDILLNYETAVISAESINGKLTSLSIVKSGKGYKQAPTLTVVDDTGVGAEVVAAIDNIGRVVSVKIVAQGENYINPQIVVRPFSVLVDYDTTGGWAVYHFDDSRKNFYRYSNQEYDVAKYITYVDWYSTTYSQRHPTQYSVDTILDLKKIFTKKLGDYVLVKNEGDGRSVIMRYDGAGKGDYLDDYSLVYRQNGTVQISQALASDLTSGFDSDLGFDVGLFNSRPLAELRIILNALRNDIFVENYAVYWKELFFNAIRYVMQEQVYTDWIYKTSFIKPYISAGPLSQQKVYRYTDFGYVEQFVEEIKPYRSKIRDFTTIYDSIEHANTKVTDFDYPSQLVEGIPTTPTDLYTLSNVYPYKDWFQNHKFGVVDIRIADGGAYYRIKPQVIILTQPGDTGYGASAVAHISGGKIVKIDIINPGKDYQKTPRVVLLGGGDYDNLKTAKVSAILGNSLVRNNDVSMTFDRHDYTGLFTGELLTESYVSDGQKITYKLTNPALQDLDTIKILLNGGQLGRDSYTVNFTKDLTTIVSFNVAPPVGYSVVFEYYKNGLYTIDTFVQNSTGALFDTYDLTFPPQLDKLSIQAFIDDVVVSSSDFKIILTEKVQSKSFSAKIRFSNTPAAGATILIKYVKNINILNSIDRIKNFYKPLPGMPGVQPTEVIKGLEYGGVQIQGLDLAVSVGWDGLPWQSGSWDNTGSTDIMVRSDGVTDMFDLGSTPVLNTAYNIYFNNIRVDDPNYGTINPQITVLSSALFKTIYADGISSTITLPVVPPTDTLIIIRKSTSDGVLLPSDEITLDTELTGGDFSTTLYAGQTIYKTANGLVPNDINVDGGQFLGVPDGAGPEELIKGQMFDNISVSVFSTPNQGSDQIVTLNFVGDGTTTTFVLKQNPISVDQIDVYVDNYVKQKYDPAHPQVYDYMLKQVEGVWNLIFVNPPGLDVPVTVQIWGIGGTGILGKQTYVITEDDISSKFITIESSINYSTVKSFYLSFAGNVLVDQNTLNQYVTLGKVQNSSRAQVTIDLDQLSNHLPIDVYQTQLIAARARVTEIIALISSVEINIQSVLSEISNVNAMLNSTPPTITVPGPGGSFITVPNPSWLTLQGDLSSLQNQYNSLEGQVFDLEGELAFRQGEISTSLNQLGPYEAGNTISIVFLRTEENSYSEVYRQVIPVVANQQYYTLVRPPGTIAPLHVMAIVEYNGKRLTPAETEYYTVNQLGQSIQLGGNVSYAGQTLDPNSVEVYINGKQLVVIKDWTFESTTNTVTLNASAANVGDAIAISVTKNADYLIYDNQIKFNSSANLTSGSYATVVTYTNHDLNLMHREVYTGIDRNSINTNRYVKNENYIWVDINGVPLIPVLDYRVIDNGRTLEIASSFIIKKTDKIVITSISSDVSVDSVAFRQTKNVFLENTYTRISTIDSARLMAPLAATDDIIYVDNLDLFRNSGNSQSGIIDIAGERIIYRNVTDEGLTGLLRATHGTGLRQTYITGTKVFSANKPQGIPYSDGKIQQTTYTTNRVTVHLTQNTGSSLTSIIHVDSVKNLSLGMIYSYTLGSQTIINSIEDIQGTTVILSKQVSNLSNGTAITFISNTATVASIALNKDFKFKNDGKDESRVTVSLGGRVLQKPTPSNNPLIKHDFNITLESGQMNSQDQSGDIVLAPEYTITYDSVQQLYFLNILQSVLPKDNTGVPIVGVEVKLLQILGKTWYSNTTNSLQSDDSVQALFLQDAPAEVPDKYYYGK